MAKKIIKEKEIKKTSAIVKNDIEKNAEIINSKSLFVDTSKDIILRAVKGLLFEIQGAKDITERCKLRNIIGLLLEKYNDAEYKNSYKSLLVNNEQENLSIVNIEGGLYKESSYIGFVFFFWNIEQMNFRIIGLTEINPLFELKQTKELYYLDVPTLSCKGIPIYWLTKGIPLSVELNISKEMDNLRIDFKTKGFSPDVLRSMMDSPQFIRIFGKQVIPLRFVIYSILLMIIEFFCIYTIMINL